MFPFLVFFQQKIMSGKTWWKIITMRVGGLFFWCVHHPHLFTRLTTVINIKIFSTTMLTWKQHCCNIWPSFVLVSFRSSLSNSAILCCWKWWLTNLVCLDRKYPGASGPKLTDSNLMKNVSILIDLQIYHCCWVLQVNHWYEYLQF